MINVSKFLSFYLSNVYRACSFFTNLDLFCIDNARVIYRKIRYYYYYYYYYYFCCRYYYDSRTEVFQSNSIKLEFYYIPLHVTNVITLQSNERHVQYNTAKCEIPKTRNMTSYRSCHYGTGPVRGTDFSNVIYIIVVGVKDKQNARNGYLEEID